MANKKNTKSKPKGEPLTSTENGVKKTAAKEQERYLVFKDGREKRIENENGKYWICENGQYRKLSKDIHGVTVVLKPVENTDLDFDSGFENIPDLSDLLYKTDEGKE